MDTAQGASEQLDKDGFVIFPKFLSSQTLRFLREQVDDVYEQLHPGVDGEWVLNLHQQLPAANNWMWDLATSPFIVGLLRKQLGPNIVLYCSQLHRKRHFCEGSCGVPGLNSEVPWHQDGGANVRTLWISLDHVSPEAGGLKMLRHGHRLGRLRYAPVTTELQLQQATYFAQNNVFRVSHEKFNTADIVHYNFPAGKHFHPNFRSPPERFN